MIVDCVGGGMKYTFSFSYEKNSINDDIVFVIYVCLYTHYMNIQQ